MAEHSRFFLDKANPRVWKALNSWAFTVSQAAEEAGVDRAVLETMYVQISQLNGCLYCMELHTRRAIELGVPPELLAMLSAWEESPLFTDVERAALAIGDAVTLLPEAENRRSVLDKARAILGDAAFGAVEWAAITMNAYNRVSIVSEHPARNPRA